MNSLVNCVDKCALVDLVLVHACMCFISRQAAGANIIIKVLQQQVTDWVSKLQEIQLVLC